MEISLDGTWDIGRERAYAGTAPVPGLASDPERAGTRWYRRTVTLPSGDWNAATLELHGARFCPAVWIDGKAIGQHAGGMTTISQLLTTPVVAPGRTVVIEIALKSLADVPADDASRIADADQACSNLASGLWDRVVLRLHRDARLLRVLPEVDYAARTLTVGWDYQRLGDSLLPLALSVEVLDGEQVVARTVVATAAPRGRVPLALPAGLEWWTPEAPRLYRLAVAIARAGRELDRVEFALGLRDFQVDGRGFRLNGAPVQLRGHSVVWSRWCRDAEAQQAGLGDASQRAARSASSDREGVQLAFDSAWFEDNIVRRLKAHGANVLRFAHGLPPQALLDLCDRHGLLVEVTWGGGGASASRDSRSRQWRTWFERCLRHPAIVLIHPGDAAMGDASTTAICAEICRDLPPLVLSQRDLGQVRGLGRSGISSLAYDSADQFDQPVLADGFGCNHLDGDGEPGGHPAAGAAFLRLLGRDHDAALRMQLLTESNSQSAEYWRRVGVAGFVLSGALGSRVDGNHHFLGALADGVPKPVWDALTAAWAARAFSVELWDRNWRPNQPMNLTVYAFNDTGEAAELVGEARIIDEADHSAVVARLPVACALPAYGHGRLTIDLHAPAQPGDWRVQVELRSPQPGVEWPVISQWRFRTLVPTVPLALTGVSIGIIEDDAELRSFLAKRDLMVVAPDDPAARLVVCGRGTWETLDRHRPMLSAAIARGAAVVMLDIGPGDLDPGVPAAGLPPETAPRNVVEVTLVHGLSARFAAVAEGESHLHPTAADDSLWSGLDRGASWLWNGLRGGAIVPARDLDVVYPEPAASAAAGGGIARVVPLAVAGNDLARTPVVLIEFVAPLGRLILAQLLTTGRLSPGFGSAGLYGTRRDPAAQQMVLNLLARALAP